MKPHARASGALLAVVALLALPACTKQPYRDDAAVLTKKIEALRSAPKLAAAFRTGTAISKADPAPLAGDDGDTSSNALVASAATLAKLGNVDSTRDDFAVGTTCADEAASVLSSGKWPSLGRHHSRKVVLACITYLERLRYALVVLDTPKPYANADTDYTGRAVLVDLDAGKAVGAYDFGATTIEKSKGTPRWVAREDLEKGFGRTFAGAKLVKLTGGI